MLIGQVSPSLDAQCFYRQRDGSWEDLAALGIGDPRPAIPAAFGQQGITVRAFDAPPARCNAPALKGYGGFDASFAETVNGQFRGGIFVAAYAVDPAQGGYPGSFNEYGANWSNGTYQFSVGGKSEKGIGKEAIRKIALLLDPSFANACLIEDRQLNASDLPALGFREPQPPDGYRVAEKSLTRQTPSASCKDTPETRNALSINLNWSMTNNGGATIGASVNRFGTGEGQLPGGFISAFGLNWTDARGTNYSVHGNANDGSAIPRETLIAVAKSLDPTLGPSTLKEADGRGDIEPQPAQAPVPARP